MPSTSITSSTGAARQSWPDFTGRCPCNLVAWTSERRVISSVDGTARLGADAAGPSRQLDLLKALGDNTRYAIYLELARSPEPLDHRGHRRIARRCTPTPYDPTWNECATSVCSTSRSAGGATWADRSTGTRSPPMRRRSGSNRRPCRCWPAWCWRWRQRLNASADDARPSACRRARRGRRRTDLAPSTLEALVSDLDRLGFDPLVTDVADDDDAAVVAFANCPFAELAERAPGSRVRPPPRAGRRLRGGDGRHRGRASSAP